MGRTAIEWTDMVWNPVTGCSKVSSGCKHCYAERWFERFRHGLVKNELRDGWRRRKFTDVRIHPERLEQPLHWRKPRRIFVNSMSDLFHEAVPDEFIAKVFGRMRSCGWHTFQVLTKRPERMQNFLSRCKSWSGWMTHNGNPPSCYGGDGEIVGGDDRWPTSNVWLGVSVEDAEHLGRIDELKACAAAKLFVSLEPLIAPVPTLGEYLDGIDWVICGGESGPKARPMHPDWARSVRDQCQDAGVPFFMKQMSDRAPIPEDLMIREYPNGK